MTNFLIDIIFGVLFIIAGAADIMLAIENFNAGQYFQSGLFIMLAIYMAVCMVKTFIK